MKRRRKFGGTSLLAVPLRSAGLGGWRRQAQLRSTASKEGRGSRGADLTTGVGLENEELLSKNKSQRVTPLLAQRITLTGNSYFWRTAGCASPRPTHLNREDLAGEGLFPPFSASYSSAHHSLALPALTRPAEPQPQGI